MPEAVLELTCVVVYAGESHVAVLPYVYSQWVPRLHDDPDSDVELAMHDEHRVLNVLLDDPDPPRELIVVVILLILMSEVVDSLLGPCGLAHVCS